MRILIAAVMWGMIALLVTACGHPLTSGTITGKDIELPHSYTDMECIAYGKYGCALYWPFHKVAPEQWYLALQDPKDPNRIGTVTVTPQAYAHYRVGMSYP